MAKATSGRESSSKTEVSVYSDTSPAECEIGNIEKRARRANRARHARKCTVCHHKDREFIDQDYLRWLSPKKIAREYAISHQSAVYRHADATGLRAQRRASLRATLENFIEQAESVRATAGSVVAAVRLYAQINDQGQWTPPVRRFVVEHRSASADPASTPAPVPVKVGLPSPITSAAHSAAPLDVSPDKFGAVRPGRNARAPQTTGGLSPDPPARCSPPLQKKHGPSSADSFAAHPAAPTAQVHKNSDPVPVASAVSPAADASPAATFSATFAEPIGGSQGKFGAAQPERNGRAPQTTGGLSADRLSPESSNAADASPAATSDAPFAEPLATAHKNSGAVQPERNARAPQTAGGSPPDRLSPVSSNAAATSPAATACPEESRRVSAQFAESTGESQDKFGALQPGRSARAPQTAGGSPPDRLSPASSNAADASPAATACPEESRRVDAQLAEPLAQAHKNSGRIGSTGSLSPVVTITAGHAVPFGASQDKFPAVPVASINFASDLPISNREHVELEHVATR
jgi:hypothetical protein